MSNHSGGYMLNEVICKAKEMGILDTIGKEKSQEFVLTLIKIGKNYDCNDGEIIEDMGAEFGICNYCLKPTDNLNEEGLCKDCADEE